MVHADAQGTETLRLRYGLAVILAGFLLVLSVSLAAMWKWNLAQEVAVVTGAVAGLVGTVVGAYFGIQVGAAGSEHVERARRDAENARSRAEIRALRLAGSSEPAHAAAALALEPQ